MRQIGLICFLLFLAGCSSGSQVQGSEGPPVDAGTPIADAGSPVSDAGTPAGDAGSPKPDAGSPPPDGGAPDAGPPSDAGPLTLNATVVHAPSGGWQILNTGSGRTNDAALDEGGAREAQQRGVGRRPAVVQTGRRDVADAPTLASISDLPVLLVAAGAQRLVERADELKRPPAHRHVVVRVR